MAIQTRHGAYEDFEPQKLLTGEWAPVTSGDPKAKDGKSVYMCFEPGNVKRMATYEDMKENIVEATSDVSEELAKELADKYTEKIQAATQAANTAAQDAADAALDAAGAATAAETAISSAQTAAQAANTAAEEANAAAQAANQAAENGKNYEGTRETFPEAGSAGILYIDTEANVMYRWDSVLEDYISVGGGSDKVVFLPYDEFPQTGEEKVLYVDESSGELLMLYRWNGSAYVKAGGKSDNEVVSDAFSEAVAYDIGDYCIYNETLYKFAAAKEPGEWDAAAAEPTTVAKEFQALNANSILYNPIDDWLYINRQKYKQAEFRLKPLIPTLSSDRGYNGDAVYTPSDYPEHAAWKAFDGDSLTYAYAKDGTSGYIGYRFDNRITARKIVATIFNPSSVARSYTLKFEYYTGTSWIEIPDTTSSQTLSVSEKRVLEYYIEQECYGIRAYYTSSNILTFSMYEMQVYGANS